MTEKELELVVKKKGNRISLEFLGDTSGWDAKKQLRITSNLIKLLEALDKEINGRIMTTWKIAEMSKDD